MDNLQTIADRAKQALTEGIRYINMDCIGFVRYILGECGRPFKTAGVNTGVRDGVFGTLLPITKETSLKAGCLLFAHNFNGGEPEKYRNDGIGDYEHIGIYVGDGDCVHSSASRGCVIRSAITNYWTHYSIMGGTPVTEEKPTITVPTFPKEWQATYSHLIWKKGDKGKGVREVQEALQKCGYNLTIDGDFGKSTEWAVKHFQKAKGLFTDGIVGKKTWCAFKEVINIG